MGALGAVCVVSGAHAQDRPRFTGAFRGLEAGGGAVFGEPNGAVFQAGARAASVLNLADVALTWRGVQADGMTHHVGAAMRLHPLFLFLLANNRLGATLGALYAELGLGARLNNGLAATWQWGVGGDVPLSPLDEGGWWIGGEIVRLCSFASSETEEAAQILVSLRLGYRFNGL